MDFFHIFFNYETVSGNFAISMLKMMEWLRIFTRYVITKKLIECLKFVTFNAFSWCGVLSEWNLEY